MLLTVDIGNTSIHNGVFDGKKIKKSFRLPTYSKSLKLEYYKKLKSCLKHIDSVIIVCVVPKVLKKVKAILKDLCSKKILVVGRNVDSGIKNLYKKPKQVGQDRLVNARAAYDLYGGSAIIVDFGTAITIDVINKRKEYIGGIIVPGVELSLNALSEKAALLPRVSLKKPKTILGQETSESMINGVVYGFSSLCDGVVEKLKNKYCKNAKVVATGGLSSFIGPYCKTISRIDPELTLKGLMIIAKTRSFER